METEGSDAENTPSITMAEPQLPLYWQDENDQLNSLEWRLQHLDQLVRCWCDVTMAILLQGLNPVTETVMYISD